LGSEGWVEVRILSHPSEGVDGRRLVQQRPVLRRVLLGATGVILATSGLAFAGVGVPLLPDQADEEAVLATTSAPSAADAGDTEEGPDGTPPAIAQENQAAALPFLT